MMRETLDRLRMAGQQVGGRLAREAANLGSFLLPQRCPGCGEAAVPDLLLCPACLARIPRVSFAVCARCLAREREPVACAAHPGFEVWPAWIYEERAAAFITALKFGERSALAASMVSELVRVVPPGGFDAVLPVPLHRARRRERGYDQAALLAAALAPRIGVPSLEGVLTRRQSTRAQTRLTPVERRRNLRGAFRVTRPEWVEGRRVLVVDDVITTGATLEAALGELREAGARAVAVTLAWAQ